MLSLYKFQVSKVSLSSPPPPPLSGLQQQHQQHELRSSHSSSSSSVITTKTTETHPVMALSTQNRIVGVVSRRTIVSAAAHHVLRSSVYSSSSSSPAIALALTAAVALAAISLAVTTTSQLQHKQQQQQENHRTMCQAAATPQATSAAAASPSTDTHFQVMAALEMKEELEKVRLAQLIHDLHELAKNGNNNDKNTENGDTAADTAAPKPKGLRRYVTMIGDTIKRTRTGNAPQRRISNSQLLSSAYNLNAEGEITADCFIKKRLSPETAKSIIAAIQAGGHLNKASVMNLIQASKRVCSMESSLIDLSDPKGPYQNTHITVVGDLHGSLPSLTSILQMVGTIGSPKDGGQTVIFNGDFVDRGYQSMEVLSILLLLKLAYPRYVFLIRGNHEDALIASVYGFRDEIRYKYGKDTSDDLWESLTDFFTSLPLAALTKSSVVVHGGIPNTEFQLEQVADITLQERYAMKSPSVETPTEKSKLVQNCLWSDPDSKLGGVVVPNPRGCGVRFGRRVAREFLQRHKLKYLIRGHEPIEEGIQEIDCGCDTQVLTVFSAAYYPAGEGTNAGAILQLHPDGNYTTYDFYPEPNEKQAAALAAKAANEDIGNKSRLQRRATKNNGVSWQAVRTLIIGKKGKLEKAFAEKCRGKKSDFVSAEVWAEVMAEVLELPEMPWSALQSSLAPKVKGEEYINWKSFLKQHSGRLCQTDMDTHQVETLHENHKMLWTVFKFLDVDNDGKVALIDFKKGIQLLNKHLSNDRQLNDPEKLFKVLDQSGQGFIDIDEFEKIFTVL